MDKTEKQAILHAMVETEKNMAALYDLYADRFAQDKDFWKKISAEEEDHAAMLGTGALHLALDRLPESVLLDRLADLRMTNASIRNTTEQYAWRMPPKEVAYNYAIQMEKSLSEAFFQGILRMKDAPDLVAVWQKLGAETVDHSKRIADLLGEG